jgi:hypothetical protein
MVATSFSRYFFRLLEPAGFYKNRIGRAIVEALHQRGSVMEVDDLAAHRTRFNTPISTSYRGHTIYEIRPPTQVDHLLLFIILYCIGINFCILCLGSPRSAYEMLRSVAGKIGLRTGSNT